MVNPQIKEQLQHLVKNWITAYENRDKALIKHIFSPSEDSFHYGTGEDERIEGLEGMLSQLERDWAQSEKSILELKDFRFESFEGRFAWVTCELLPHITMAGNSHTLPLLRVTLVAVLKDKEWKIAHSHGSWPFQDQQEGQSFPEQH